MARDRVFHVEHGRQLAAGRLAIVEGDFASFHVQVNAQGTLPLRRGELDAKACQAQVGQYLVEALCDCLRVHKNRLFTVARNKKWAPTAHSLISPMSRLFRGSFRASARANR